MGLSMKQEATIHFPYPHCSSICPGAQKGNVPQAAFSPLDTPPPSQPSVGLESRTAQPRASLSDATAKYQTTYRAFPEIWCSPSKAANLQLGKQQRA